MTDLFDEAAWQQIITQPDWYITLYPALKELRKRWEASDDADTKALKQAVRHFFETNLQNGRLALGTSGPNLDAARLPIDTIVIHHTSSKPGYRLPYMNAVQLLNIYVPNFNDPTHPAEKEQKGRPLWSNHVRDGRPVFYAYHWLLRMDGRAERLLHDQELGWHAANWDINCRSVAICLDNDYAVQDPTPETLRRLAQLIVEQYPYVNSSRIFGHNEVSLRGTTCPGNHFVDVWKNQLVKLVDELKS